MIKRKIFSFHTVNASKMLLFLFLGVLSCIPSLLTWQLFNFWLSDLGHNPAFIASLSIMGIPNYFKILFIPYLEIWQPPPVHPNRWINWMIYSCLFSTALTFILGNTLPYMAYWVLVSVGTILIIAGIIFEKALYCFQILCLEESSRTDAICCHKMGHRIGSSFGEITGLCIAYYYGWSSVYLLFSVLFLVASGGLFCLQGSFYAQSLSHSSSFQSPIDYFQLAKTHHIFLWVCFIVNSGDGLAGWFLPLYLRDLGLSYIEIALVGKSWGLLCFFLGAYMGRILWSRPKNLFFWAMLSSTLHGISLLPFSQTSFLKEHLVWIFFFKNITLGLKSVLITAVISEYLGSARNPVGLYFLSSIARALVMFMISAISPIMVRDPSKIFWIASSLTIPGLWALQKLYRRTKILYQKPSIKEDPLKIVTPQVCAQINWRDLAGENRAMEG